MNWPQIKVTMSIYIYINNANFWQKTENVKM